MSRFADALCAGPDMSGAVDLGAFLKTYDLGLRTITAKSSQNEHSIAMAQLAQGSSSCDTYGFQDVNRTDMYLGFEHFIEFGQARAIGRQIMSNVFNKLIDGGPTLSAVDMLIAQISPNDRILHPVPYEGIITKKRSEVRLDPALFDTRISSTRSRQHLLGFAVEAGSIIVAAEQIATSIKNPASMKRQEQRVLNIAAALRNQFIS